MENNLFYFDDLDPIFKVAGGIRLLDNGLSARHLLNEWMDFDQTCTAILFRQRQELIRFFSSPEHKLRVSYCHHPMSSSVVVRRPSFVVNN